MKRMKWNCTIWGVLLWVGLLTGCSSSYRMVTTVRSDGTLHRKVFAYADSTFLSGDRSHNPYWFALDDRWTVVKTDSVLKEDLLGESQRFNVWVEATFHFPDDSAAWRAKELWMVSMAEPKEQLKRRFRWFYTYHEYRCRFLELADKGPVPLENYLTLDEQKLLFGEGLQKYTWMNGAEMKDRLDVLSDKFQKWLNRTQYELCLEGLTRLRGSNQEDTALVVDRDRIYQWMEQSKKEVSDLSPNKLCQWLDEYYRKDDYSAFYAAHAQSIEEWYEQRIRVVDLFGGQIKFELNMPGRLTSTNARLTEENGVLVWKVDPYRLLQGDCYLEAQSRTVNVWAFVVTAFFIVLPFFLWGLRRRKRNKE